MNKIVAIILLAMPLAAQTKYENNISPTTRIYEPKYLKGERAAAVGRFVESLMVTPTQGLISMAVHIRWEPSMNLMVISAQQPEGVDRAEALLKRFDVPPPAPPPEKPMTLTIQLVRATTDPKRAQGSVPPELEPVIKEMKGSLPYVGFTLVDTMNVNLRDGLRIEDALPAAASNNSLPHFYNIEFHDPTLSGDGKVLSVPAFHFGVKIPVSVGNVQYQEESITTPLTIVGDQKQVLGKITLSPTSGDVLFVVLSRK